jgi:hypothetical protein
MIVWDGTQMINIPDVVIPPAPQPAPALPPARRSSVTIESVIDGIKNPDGASPSSWSGAIAADLPFDRGF